MSKLSAFLHPAQPEPKEVIISNRFVDDDGNPVPFKIRPLTQEENAALIKRAKRVKVVNGVRQEAIDSTLLSALTVLEATIEPDFKSKEVCDAFGVLDPTMVPGKMLLSGEYAKLMQEITALSGFDTNAEDEAKN